MYKYIFILPIILFFGSIFFDYLNDFLPTYLNNFYLPVLFIFPIIFIVFSKILESIFKSKLNKSFYDYKLLDSEKIKNNLENKLINGRLDITDIFEKFDLIINNSDVDYNLNISLSLNIGTYHTEGKNTYNVLQNIYTLDLFNYKGKGYFDLNKVNLLENNYDKLEQILINSNSKRESKIYYTLDYKFESSYLSDLTGTRELYLNFKK